MSDHIQMAMFLVFLIVAGVIGFFVTKRHAAEAQRWAGTVHAAILHARANKQAGPHWLEQLEDAFEDVYMLTHGKAPTQAIIGRGVADMANVMSNHLLNDNRAVMADHFVHLIDSKSVEPVGPAGEVGPVGVAGATGHPGPIGARGPRRSFSTMGLIALALASSCAFTSEKPEPVQATVEAIAFAPNSSSKLGYGDCDCTATVVDVLSHAKKTVIVQAYNFTSEDIAKALIDAHKRGVDVQIVGDRSVPTERSSQAQACADAGIKVLIDKKHHIAHNKVIVVDGDVVITGSFNWTASAENNNAENLLVIRSDKIAAIYAANWKVHSEHSEPFGK